MHIPRPSLCLLPPKSLFFSSDGDCSRDAADLPGDWRFSIFLATEGAISPASGSSRSQLVIRGGFLWRMESANLERSARRLRRVLSRNKGESRLNYESPFRVILRDHCARILRFPPPDYNLRRSSTRRCRDLRHQASVSTSAEKIISFSQATSSPSSPATAMAAPD
ncbi:hypothetical protein TIFTF001_043917 [Ficus carica]|uniref:Uncharacterized protein n=1 Tax=Ficus carica TaxID=3494 RepID=A0AA87Z4J2_FICCA|nr:hypothetical protein TIFTF001_043917 [Ficus carica]